jgi:hypothetical protein
MKQENKNLTEDILHKCQSRIWKIQMEMETYSSLFYASTFIDLQNLMGAGLAFARMARKLEKVRRSLDKTDLHLT